MSFFSCSASQKILKKSVSETTASSGRWKKDPFLLITPQANPVWLKFYTMNVKNTILDRSTLRSQEAMSVLVKENLSQCAVDKNKSGNKSSLSWRNTAEVSSSTEVQEKDNTQKWSTKLSLQEPWLESFKVSCTQANQALIWTRLWTSLLWELQTHFHLKFWAEELSTRTWIQDFMLSISLRIWRFVLKNRPRWIWAYHVWGLWSNFIQLWKHKEEVDLELRPWSRFWKTWTITKFTRNENGNGQLIKELMSWFCNIL